GKVLAERGADATIRVYDLAKGGEARQFAAQPAAAPAPPGAVVVAAPARFQGGAGAALVFSPDGKLLATAGSASPAAFAPVPVNGRAPNRSAGAISLIDVSTGKAIRKIEPSVPVVGYAFSPDGRTRAGETAEVWVGGGGVAGGRGGAGRGRAAAPAAPAAPQGLAPAQVVKVAGLAPASADTGTPTPLAFS